MLVFLLELRDIARNSNKYFRQNFEFLLGKV